MLLNKTENRGSSQKSVRAVVCLKLDFCVLLITTTDTGRDISSSSVSVTRRSEGSAPSPSKSHQNRKGNWPARSESFLHAEQQHSFYEGVERRGFVWLKTGLDFSKISVSWAL